MLYIPITNEEQAKFLSLKLWELTRPAETRDPNDVTKYYCGWIIHPETNAVMMELPDNDLVPIHVSANSGLLDEILSPFVEFGAITIQDLENIHIAIEEHKGNTVSLAEFIPEFWLNQSKTREELELEGWFSAIDITSNKEMLNQKDS